MFLLWWWRGLTGTWGGTFMARRRAGGVCDEPEMIWPSERGPGRMDSVSACLALASLESGIALADHEQLAASTNDLAIRVT